MEKWKAGVIIFLLFLHLGAKIQFRDIIIYYFFLVENCYLLLLANRFPTISLKTHTLKTYPKFSLSSKETPRVSSRLSLSPSLPLGQSNIGHCTVSRNLTTPSRCLKEMIVSVSYEIYQLRKDIQISTSEHGTAPTQIQLKH